MLDTLVAVYGRAVLLPVRHRECCLAIKCDPVSRPLDKGGIGRRNATIRPWLGRARCGPQAQRLVEHADRRRSGFAVASHDPGREDRNSLDCLLLKHEHLAAAFSDGRQIDVLRNLDQRRRCHPFNEKTAPTSSSTPRPRRTDPRTRRIDVQDLGCSTASITFTTAFLVMIPPQTIFAVPLIV